VADTSQAWYFPWQVFFTVLSFTWGACIGSFLNVCIYRIPRELSVVKPRSFCPACSKPIPWYCNIPILSYLVLGAKCGSCGARISARYFLVELSTAVLFLLVWMKFDSPGTGAALWLVPALDWKLVPVYWLMVSGLLLGTFVDFEHMIIPDRVTLGGIAAGIVLSVIVPSMHGVSGPLLGLAWSLAGAGTGWILMWSVAFFGKMIFMKDAMGFGDVKLLGAIGAFIGWKAVLFTVMFSSLIGSVAGVSLVVLHRRKMQSRIPYGPYLALAAIVWVLWGSNIWEAYLGLFTPAELYQP